MHSHDLPNMTTLTLGHCLPSCSCIHICEITPARVTYKTYPTAINYNQQEKTNNNDDLLDDIDIKDQFYYFFK